MTDSDSRDSLAPLEPWALELEGESANPRTREELARVVALLRSLPDPEPPADLAARVLERVAQQSSQPGVLRVAFGAARRRAFPRLALAMAAGIAGLLAITAFPGSLSMSSFFGFQDGTPGSVGPRVLPGTVAGGAGLGARRPPPALRPSAAVIRPQFVSVFSQAPAAGHPMPFARAPIDDAFDRRLDLLLNQLMLDPTAFARRLEQMAQRDQFIARLAERAARRGDAPEIALHVRQSPHPLAGQLVNTLLHASLVASVSPR